MSYHLCADLSVCICDYSAIGDYVAKGDYGDYVAKGDYVFFALQKVHSYFFIAKR
jgi:hypothetical protein